MEQTDDCCNALEEALRDEGRDITRVQRRGLRRFALVWLAGEKALKYGLLPFGSDAVAESVMSAARRWLDDNQNQYNPVRNMLEELQLTLVTKAAGTLSPCVTNMPDAREIRGDSSITKPATS